MAECDTVWPLAITALAAFGAIFCLLLLIVATRDLLKIWKDIPDDN